MNTAILLAGGTGKRMQMDQIPKQFIEIENRRILDFSLQTFQNHPRIDQIVIVADSMWFSMIEEELSKFQITKFVGYAKPGKTRQFSIFHALQFLEGRIQNEDGVIIHDAARPLVSENLITQCLDALDTYDGAMPVLPVKDTFYRSKDGKAIYELLPREELFAGQAPESFRFGLYLDSHYRMTEQELLEINGSSEIAYKNQMNILLIQGEEKNFKITTREDLDLLKMYLDEEGNRGK